MISTLHQLLISKKNCFSNKLSIWEKVCEHKSFIIAKYLLVYKYSYFYVKNEAKPPSSILFWHHISIHVPAWGTTKYILPGWSDSSYFNPRSRVGNDLLHCPISFKGQSFQSTFPRGERLRTGSFTAGL